MIISLCDLTGIFVKPWVDAGYNAMIIDPQHKGTEWHGHTLKVGMTIEQAMPTIREAMKTHEIIFVAGFPPCTDLAVSGAAHFANKAAKDKHFQAKAAQIVWQCHMVAELAGCPYIIENPVSALSSIWRKPCFSFHPYEFGAYLPENDKHPQYPQYIKPRDAYPKKTCLWTGGGFNMPNKKPVAIEEGYSDQHKKLGGKSLKTKNIRSATPRGFAQAVFEKYGLNNDNH